MTAYTHFLFFLQYLSTFLSILYSFRRLTCVSLLGILHICSILYSCGVLAAGSAPLGYLRG